MPFACFWKLLSESPLRVARLLSFRPPLCAGNVLRFAMDRKFPAVLVTAAIATEVFLPHRHDAMAPPPHIEPEIKASVPSTLPLNSLGGNAVSTESLGSFRWNTFYRKMRRLGMKKGEVQRFGMLEAYFETARAIAERYPDLKKWERQHQYNCFKSEINLTSLRTRGCKDYSSALPVIAQVLGVPEVCISSPVHV